jgi:hypothetical protein
MTSSPDTPRPVPDGSQLRLGEYLHASSLTSPSGRFTLLNTVTETALYDHASGAQLWAASNENVYGQAILALGLDGDLTVWNHHRQPGRRSGTAGQGTTLLQVTDAGDVILLDGQGRELWTTNTAPPPAPIPAVVPDVARGSVLRRGQILRHQVLVSDDGGTALMHAPTGLGLYGRGQGFGRREPMDPGAYLSLDSDGFLRVRSGDAVVKQLAGPGEQLVVLPGRAELHDESGAVVWSMTGSLRQSAATPGPSQAELAVCFDSLATGHGYTAVVVRDLEPAKALSRWDLTEVSTATWPELRARCGDGEVAVAAVPLGDHTLLMTSAPWVQGGDQLSAGTTAVRHSYDPQRDWSADWSLHRDGVTIAHVREEQPKRRKGMELPEVLAAVEEMNEDQSWSDPDWFASFASLELMCRVAGVAPTAAELRGPVLGGVLPASLVQPPVVVRPGRPDRPPLVIEDDLVVVRTDFSDDAAWATVLDEVRAGAFGDEFEAEEVLATDDPGWQGADFEEVLAALPEDHSVEVVYLVDAVTMTHPEHAVLAASTDLPEPSDDYQPQEGVFRTLRIDPGMVTVMHANLQIANLSWEEYCEQVEDPENDVLTVD